MLGLLRSPEAREPGCECGACEDRRKGPQLQSWVRKDSEPLSLLAPHGIGTATQGIVTAALDCAPMTRPSPAALASVHQPLVKVWTMLLGHQQGSSACLLWTVVTGKKACGCKVRSCV